MAPAGSATSSTRPACRSSGAFLFRDPEHAVTLTVTLWSDEATEKASGEAVQQHLDKWAEMTGRVPTIETFEVIFAELPSRTS